MLALLIALSLAAGPRGPVASRQASLAVYSRSPAQALPLARAFLARAGRLAPALSPEVLGPALASPLGADLLDPASLSSAGVDLSSPITWSDDRGAAVVCLTGGRSTGERLERALAKKGLFETRGYGGARLVGEAVGKSWRSGFAAKANQFCFASGADVLEPLKSSVDAMGGAGLAGSKAWAGASAGVEGPLIVFASGRGTHMAVALRPSAEELTAKGRWVGPSLLGKPRESDAQAPLSAAAPFVAWASLAPAALSGAPQAPGARALAELVAALCPACAPSAARELWEGLRGKLAWKVGLVVAGVDPSAAGQPHAEQFLFKHAYLMALEDEKGALAAVRSFSEKLRAAGVAVAEEAKSPDRAQFTVAARPRAVTVDVGAKALVVANDAGARELALQALAKGAPEKPAHAARFALDGPRAAAALARISLLDIGRSPELGMLFATSIEAGPLLKAAGTIAGWADPDPSGGTFEAGFSLAP